MSSDDEPAPDSQVTRTAPLAGADEGTFSLTGAKPARFDPAATATTVQMPSSPGQREWKEGDVLLDTYVVRKLLGAGGMGKVFQVSHRGWNIELAVKTPLPELVDNEASRSRFVREAEIWVDLGVHPNIVACYFVRDIGGLPRIFAEYVDGGDLRSWLGSAGHKSWSQLLSIAINVCDGMAYAHAKGLVHRDLKPGNVMLDRDGTAKASDFGLTKVMGFGGTSSGADAADASPDGVSAVSGTPEYMPPEQWRGAADIGPTADVYAFGVMLFEMITGRRPFGRQRGESVHALFVQHLTAEPPLVSAERPDTPSDVAALVRRCLAKRPEQRPASFDEAAAVLRRSYRSITGMSHPAQQPSELRLRADALNNRALSLYDLGRRDQALSCWDESLRLDPDHLESNYNAGLVRWRTGDETDQRIRERLVVASEKQGHRALLRWFDLARGDVRSALQSGHAAAPEPSDVDEILSSSAAFIAAGRHERALELIDRDAALTVASEPAQRIRALALWGLGRRDEAAAAWPAAGADGTIEPLSVAANRLSGLAGGDILWAGPGVHDIRFAPDGHSVWVACSDRVNRIELPTGVSETVLTPAFSRNVWKLAIDARRRHLFSCSGLGPSGTRLSRYELRERALPRSIDVQDTAPHSIFGLEPHPDGHRLLVIAVNEISLWDVNTGRYLPIFIGHSDQVRHARFLPGTDRIVSVAADGTARVWDASGHARIVKGVPHGGLFALDVSEDGTLLLTGGSDRIVRLWRLDGDSLDVVREWRGHAATVSAVAFVPGWRWILSGDVDGTLCQWPSNGSQCRRTMVGVVDTIHDLHVAPDGGAAAVRSVHAASVVRLSRHFLEPAFQVSRVRTPQQLVSTQQRFDTLLSEAHEASQQFADERAYGLLRTAQALAGFGKSADVMERLRRLARSGRPRHVRDAWMVVAAVGHRSAVTGVADLSEQRWMVSCATDGQLLVWDGRSGARIASLQGHRAEISCLAVGPGSSHVLTGAGDGHVRFWDLARRECLAWFDGIGREIVATFIRPDGLTALSVSQDCVIAELDLEIGEVRARHRLAASGFRCAAVTPDARHIAVGLQGGGLAWWEARRPERLAPLEPSTEMITALAIAADGSWLAAGSEERGLRLVQLGNPAGITRRAIAPGADDTRSAPTALAFATGGLLAAVDLSGDVAFWSVPDGRRLGALHGATTVTALSCSDGGHWVTTGHADGRVQRWEVDWHLEWAVP